MIHYLILASALLAGAVQAQAPAEPSCVANCHGKEATAFRAGVHKKVFSCTKCHGGNPKALRDKARSHDPEAGFLGKPARAKIPELCGGCHSDPLGMHAYGIETDQLAQYRISSHGRAVLEKGNLDAAVCSDCHGAHGILPAHDPRAPTARVNQPETCGRCHSDKALMERAGLPFDSVDRFRAGIHGDALLVQRSRGAPSCTDCHGSHGALPPGVGDAVQICGQCHLNTAEHYAKSAHAKSGEMRCAACHEDKKDDPAFRRSDCTVCHGSHAIRVPGDAMYDGDQVGHCGHCHRQEGEADKLEALILGGRRKLENAVRETKRELAAAKRKGFFVEYEALYEQESARTLVSLQPMIHSLDAGVISKHLEDGLKRQDRTREIIAKKTEALRDRRILLSGLALVLLLLLGLLAVKLKAVRRLS